MRKALLPLLALALLLCACGGALYASPSAEEPTPYEKDYAYLWEQLESSYPYLPYLRSRGLDTEEILSILDQLPLDRCLAQIRGS